MIRVWRPDLEFGDINRRSVICTVGRADSDEDIFKNRCRGQAVAEGKMKRISGVSSDEELCIAFAVRSGALDVQDNGKQRRILRVYDLVGKGRGDNVPVCWYCD